MAGHDAFDIGVTFAILEHTLDIVVFARYYWVHQLHLSRHQSSVTFKKGVSALPVRMEVTLKPLTLDSDEKDTSPDFFPAT